MFCSKCGAENADGARFCAKCGTPVAAAAPPVAPPPVQQTYRVPEAAPGAQPVVPGAKLPWLAAVLSLVIVGAGQLYNSDWKKGVAMFVGFVLVFVPTSGIVSFFIWVWSMIDAYQVAAGKGKVW